MRVAFLLRKFPVLSETFILDQIVGLIDRGVEVDIYAVFEGDWAHCHPLVEAYGLCDRTYFPPVPFSPRVIPRLLRAPQLLGRPQAAPLAAQLKSLNVFKYRFQALFLHLLYLSSRLNGTQHYDIIHCHFGMYGLVGVDLRDLGLISGKIVTSFHGMDIHVYPRRHGRGVYRRLFAQGDLFTVNSHFTGSKLKALGCPADKIVKLPVGLNTQLYGTAGVERPSADGPVRLLTVARLTEKKGLEYSIRAVANLAKAHPHIRYDIVGVGPLQTALTQLIASIKADAYIHLLGQRNQVELRALYNQADIFVLASVTAADGDMEGQGLVLQEAQASGLPVVSTWHNGIPEGVLVNESAFLVPERQVEPLTERLAYLVSQPAQRQRLDQAGQTFVRQTFDIALLTDQLLTLYKGLL